MNILPKKRWHVRTKENVARVRKDIAEAAELEKANQTRIQNADREARLNVLRAEASKKLNSYEAFQITQPDTTNLDNTITSAAQTDFTGPPKTEINANKLHDKEIKDEKEEYEKKIGYLTYLGQATNEILGKKNWYEVLPEHIRGPRRSENIKDSYDKLILKGKVQDTELDKTDEVQWQAKQLQDPIRKFKKFTKIKEDFQTKQEIKTDQIKDCTDDYKSVLGNHSKEIHVVKHKKRKHKRDRREHSSHKDSNKQSKEDTKLEKLKELRKLRLKREEEEKRKATIFLNRLTGVPEKSNESTETKTVTQKYNSQFNPDIARQNFR